MVSGFFEPLFYLVGLGVGVGALVGDITYGGQTISYQEFVAPALLAASAMNGAIYETTGNVFFKLNYAKTYDGVLATPMGVRDVAVGETIFALMRGSVYAVAFVVDHARARADRVVVGAARRARGAPDRRSVRGARPLRGDADALVGRLRVHRAADAPDVPVLGDVRPARRVPAGGSVGASVTPLYHGVDLMRELTLGNVGWDALIHVAYLLGVLALGVWFTARRLERKLLK